MNLMLSPVGGPVDWHWRSAAPWRPERRRLVIATQRLRLIGHVGERDVSLFVATPTISRQVVCPNATMGSDLG